MTAVLISAGHSDYDPGTAVNNVKESDLTLELRNLIADRLKGSNINVVTDGLESENLALPEAIKLIKDSDLALELHFNSAPNAEVKGTEAYAPEHLMEVGDELTKIVSSVLETNDRKTRNYSRSNRSKLGFVSEGGIILEIEFISNKEALDNYQAKKNYVADIIASYVKEKYGTEKS